MKIIVVLLGLIGCIALLIWFLYDQNKRLCVGCGMCTRVCAHDAITIDKRKAQINHDKCVGCGRCEIGRAHV